MNDLMLVPRQESDPLLMHQHVGLRPPASSPRDLLFVLFWHRRKVTTFFCVTLFLTAVAVLAMPSRYRSEASLLNKLGSETVTPDVTAGIGGPVIQPVIGRDMQMKTELEVLRSNEIALAVVHHVGPGTILNSAKQPATDSEQDPLFKQGLLALKNNISLDIVPDSNVLTIAYESSDAKLAQTIAGVYVDQYLSHRTKVYTNAKSAKFLTDERNLSTDKLRVLEDQVRTIKDEAGVGNVDEQRLILQQRIGTLQAGMTDARTARVTADTQVEQITEQLKTVPPRITTQQTHNQAMNWVDDLRKDVVKREQELTDLKTRYLPNSPQVKILEEKLAGSRALLANAGDEGGERVEAINPTFQELSTRLQTSLVDAKVAQAKQSTIEEQLADASAALKKVNDVEQRVKALLRSQNQTEDTFKIVAQAADRAGLLSAFEDEKLNNVSVVQPATMPLRPVAPNRLMLLGLGLFVAASGAVGLGIAAETLSRSTKRPEDIDRMTHLPSVSVPVVEEHSYLGQTAAAAKNGGVIAKLLPGKTPTTLVTRTPHTATNVAGPRLAAGTIDVRPLRRWSPQLLQSAHGIVDGLLFDAILKNPAHTAFVTGLVSCRPGQGASTLAAYVASAMADRLEASMLVSPEDQVLLIDTDLNEPSQGRLLGTGEGPGLGDWLSIATDAEAGVETFIHETSHPRLSLMPAGRSASGSRLLDRSERLLIEAKRHHRHVVLDLPAVSTSPTSLRLAAKCNAVLLVVECGNLHQEVVRKSVRALQGAGANVVGVVLNKRRFPIPDWLYDVAA